MNLIAARRTPLLRLALASAVVAALYGAPSAHASTASSADVPAAGSAAAQDTTTSKKPIALAPVMVSANKRVEKLENVPMSISVLNTEQLQRANVGNFDDIVNIIPAVTVAYSTTPDNFAINMRGIGTMSIGVGVESDVSVVIDDVPYGAQYQAFTGLGDISRVEVLKGPQSTLFGKNAIAGVISYITAPTGGPAGAKVGAYYTSDGEWRAQASVHAPVGDKFSFRLAASDSRFPGNVENLTNGKEINGWSGKTLMGKFTWNPTDNLTLEFSPHYSKSNNNCCVPVYRRFDGIGSAVLKNTGTPAGSKVPVQVPATTLLAGIPIGPDNVYTRTDFPTGLTSTDKGASLHATYTFANGATLMAISSFDKYTALDYRDQDFFDVPVLQYFPWSAGPLKNQPSGVNYGITQIGTHRLEAHTDEIRLTSPDDGSFKYVAGLWYGKNGIDRNLMRGYPNINASSPVQYLATTYNQTYAAFGQASWEFVPSWTVVGGLRFNREVSGYSFAQGQPTTATPAPYPPSADFTPSTVNLAGHGYGDNAVTGRFSLQHQFNDKLMAYASYSTGYKGQAYALTTGLTALVANSTFPVKAETAKSFELGIKDNFWDGRATLNASLFHTRFYNYQQNVGIQIPGSEVFQTVLYSIPYVQTKGAEADLAIVPMENMLVNASLAYTLATVGPWQNGPCYTVFMKTTNGGFNDSCVLKNPAFGGTNTQDLTGARMPNAPKIRANLSVRYDIPLATSFDAFVTASERYQSASTIDVSQNPFNNVPAYAITNLSFGIADKAKRYKLSFYVNNLFDRQYLARGFGIGTGWSSTNGTPLYVSGWTPTRDAFRYFGVGFDWNFR